MFNSQTIIFDTLSETSPQQTMIDKVTSLLMNEFNDDRKYHLTWALNKLDFEPCLKTNKQGCLLYIYKQLKALYPNNKKYLLWIAKYVSKELNRVYTWLK